MFIVDLIDCIVCYGKRNIFKIVFILLLVVIVVFIIKNVCCKIVIFVLKVFEIIVNDLIMVFVDVFIRKYLGCVGNKINICVIGVVKFVILKVLLCNVVLLFVFIGLVEVGFVGYILYKLVKNKKVGKINEDDYNREKWKLLVEGILVIMGSVIGGVIG